MSAVDKLKQKIKQIREEAAAIEVRLTVTDGSVVSVDQLRDAVDEIMVALIEIAEAADDIERNYGAAIEFLKTREELRREQR